MSIIISNLLCPEKPDGINISSDGKTLISVGFNVSGEVIVPEGVTHIDDWAFSGSHVRKIELPSTLRTFGDRVFDGCGNLIEIIIPEGLQELTFCIFRSCRSLWKVSLPKSLTTLGNASFEYCSWLNEISIPENVKKIPDSAFGHCSSLRTCILPNGLETIGHAAFHNCYSLNYLDLPISLKCIEWDAFYGCGSLAYIKIPKFVSEIGVGAFGGTNVYIEVDDENPNFSSINGSLFDKEKKKMLSYHASAPICVINEPKSIESISGRTFAGLNILAEIKIDVPAKELDYFPFYGCKNLKKIVLPEGLIKFEGCGNCINLEEIYLPDSIEEICQCAFDNCESLRKVKLPFNLKLLGYSHQGQCFSGCTSLEQVEFNDKLEFIASSTFSRCNKLKDITLPKGITSIGSYAFYACENIKELIIPSSVKEIGFSAFEGCKSLETFICLSCRIKISPHAFVGCVNLKKVEIHSFSISDLFLMFSDCINLEEIIYYENDNKISFDVNSFRNSWKEKMKLMSMFYYNMDMNIIKVKGSNSGKKSFKEPFEENGVSLNFLETKRLDKATLVNQSWDNISGLALVLRWNNFQVIDVDEVYDPCNIPKMIESYLSLLGLPSNYPWVVKSGSGTGFHIIFISDKIDKDIDIYPFVTRNDLCKNLELRTGGILVLPPSIHSSGKNYEFYKKEMPMSFPLRIDTNTINDFLLDICGDYFCSDDYTFNNKTFELCEYKKLKSLENFSRSSNPVSYSDDTIEWLTHCKSSHSYNSYAIRLVLGEDVKADEKKALEYFKLANNDCSYFNIVSLMSVGYFNGSLAEIEYYLCKIDYKKIYSCFYSDLNYHYWTAEEDWEIKKENIRKEAKQNLKKGRLLLFLDTATTGYPKNANLSVDNIDNWPRMVKIIWILTNENGQRLNKKEFIIKPTNFTISDDTYDIHGITNDYALKNGHDIHYVLEQFQKDVVHASLIIGHNVSFDRNVVSAELIRNGINDYLENKSLCCTMKLSKSFCKIRGLFGYKYPKLQELYKKLFGTTLDINLNSDISIEAMQKCYWELKNRGIIV